jgi:glycosyltransferase involved in cell wall biosynthesis
LKALHTFRTYFPDPPGGVQEVIRQICLSTSKLGVTNSVFCLSPDPTPLILKMEETTIIREKSWMSPASCDIGGLKSIHTFSKQVKQANIIHYHFPWPFADIMHMMVRPTIPTVMTYHSDIVRQRFLGAAYAPLMKKMLSKMDIIVATSPAYAETSKILTHPSIRDRVRVIPLGIEESSYQDVNEDESNVFSRLSILGSEPFFLFLGVPRYYKGVHTLIEAAQNIHAKIVIAGSGGESQKLMLQAKQLNLKNIVFAGYVTDAEKIALIKKCTAMVLPSHLRSEAFGVVLIEAAMYGKPMISCEIGTGTSYINSHLKTGFVVEPEKALALEKAMNTLLNDTKLAKQMGMAARARYEELFSGDALGTAYTRLYKELT